ncbi:MAG TPA: MarR family transcriptional regulator [Gemmatimonadaceae bacterium]|nr:MarR family transcriptional regulator [Gemmatimonadaceae bacterium]
MNDTVANDTVAETLDPHWTFSVLHAAHLIEDRIEGALGKVGLSMAKHGALRELAAAGEPLTLSQLATRLSCVRSNMTQLVDRLEADGLVKRLDDPTDRRSIRAELTGLGKEKYVAGNKAVKRVQGEFAASLTTKERTALEAALGALR